MRRSVRKQRTGRAIAGTAIVLPKSLHGDRSRLLGPEPVRAWECPCSCSCSLMRARMLAWILRPVPSVCAASGKAVGAAGAMPAVMMASAWSARVRSRKHRLRRSAIRPCPRLGLLLWLRLPAFGCGRPGLCRCCLRLRAAVPACLWWCRPPASVCVPARAWRPLRRRAARS